MPTISTTLNIATAATYTPDGVVYRALFFDSRGKPWMTCEPDHPEVVVGFGPTTYARPAKPNAPQYTDVRQVVVRRVWPDRPAFPFLAECDDSCPVCGVNGTHKGRFENSQGFLASVCELELETY